MINDPGFFTLKDDAILFYVQSDHVKTEEKFETLDKYLSGGNDSPIKEKLLWEKATLAEQIRASSEIAIQNAYEIYEELILTYPNGFYAPYARDRLSKLSNQKNS